MIPKKRNYIFDFDSTLTRVEALDVLAEITLKENPKKEQIIQEIIDITNLGIDGEISFTESLERRIKLLNANQADLSGLVEALKKQVSKSIESNKDFFENYAENKEASSFLLRWQQVRGWFGVSKTDYFS